MFFVTEAFAQTGGGQGAAPAAGIMNMLPIVLIVLVFYFFIIRPQSKKAKDHREFLGALKRGDKVVTASGILGSVAAIDDAKGIVTVEIAKDTQVKFLKSQISSYQKVEESAK